MVLGQALEVKEVVDPPGDPGCGLALALDGPEKALFYIEKLFTIFQHTMAGL